MVLGDGDGVIESNSDVLDILHDLDGVDDVLDFLLLLVQERRDA